MGRLMSTRRKEMEEEQAAAVKAEQEAKSSHLKTIFTGEHVEGEIL